MLLEEENRNPLVLVVDDEHLNVTWLSRLLERAGVGTVAGITNSCDVMRNIEKLDPDIVLLDLHMPAPDGLDILDQISQLNSGTSYLPVVVLTDDISVEARDQALAGGAVDFLTKPFSEGEILLRVRNHIRTKRLHDLVRRQAVTLSAQLKEIADVDSATRARIRRVTRLADDADNALTIVFQPIVDLTTRTIIGAEALTRFDAVPIRPPDEWFADAAEAGVALQLELAAVRKAIAQADRLPEDAFLSVNVSPPTFRSPALADLVRAGIARPLVIELTEHEQIDDYQPIIDAMSYLRPLGVRLAVDDAGSGFASLHHVLKLQPDFIKLDLFLVSGIDTDMARRSLAAALVRFSSETGAGLIAEGIETEAELVTLRELGINIGQGYHLGRPDHLPLTTQP